jgi:2-polyprenyl-3-methyl-5-hydroxy-6-metoxy-1,4-benzoquinol methylase
MMQSGAYSDPVGFETLEIFSGAPAVNHWVYEKIGGYIQGQIIEIGSGIGNISGFLLTDHAGVSLSDLRAEYCHILEQKFGSHPHLRNIYTLDLSNPDFRIRHADLLEKFDTVIVLNVIEHIQDDLSAIMNAKALLRDKGKMVILVPAFPGLFNSLDRQLGHYRRYTRAVLKQLMESAGLQFTGCRYFDAAAIAGWWFSGSLLKDKIISPSKLRFYNQLVPLFRILDRLVSPFAGISLISAGINNLN